MQYKHFKTFILKEMVKDYISYYLPLPFIYAVKSKYLLNRERDRTVTNKTELVLEGYPRSANSFMSSIFHNCSNLILSDHTHYASNVILGLRKKKNIIVLIREPKEAVLSLVSLYIQSQVRDYGYSIDEIKDKDISALINVSIKRYERFYTILVKYDAVIFLPFDQITKKTHKVIEFLNNSFGYHLSLDESHSNEHEKNDTENVVNRVLSQGAYHLGPSKERNMIKKKVEELYQLNKRQSIQSCNILYKTIVANSPVKYE
jgi:hypothetical protein